MVLNFWYYLLDELTAFILFGIKDENDAKFNTKCLRARPKAERVLLRIRENPEYERPAGRGHAFERLISLEPKARLTSGFFWWVPPSLLPCMGPMPNHASTHCGTWRVLLGGCHKCSACCFSVTAGPIALKFGMQLGTH